MCRCSMAFDAQVVPSFENPINSTFSQQSTEILSSEKHCDFDITSTSSLINVSLLTNDISVVSIDLVTKSTDRVRVHRLAKDLSDTILISNLEDDLKVTALANTIKDLNLTDKLKTKLELFESSRKRSGRKLTSLETRLEVWNLWHDSSAISTNTSRPAQLKVSAKPKIQMNLPFNSSTTLTSNKRNIQLYQNMWQITNKSFKQLFHDYISTHPKNLVSYGTFISLKPFYLACARYTSIPEGQ